MTPAAHALALALAQARRQHQPLRPDTAHQRAVPDAQTAYEIQNAIGMALGEWPGDGVPQHWKSGGPARDGVLSHAPLLPSGVRSGGPGAPADLSDRRFFAPGVEAEIALRLGCPVTAEEALTLTAATAESLIDAMAVAIEITDSRWQDDPALTPRLKTADLQVHGALVLGAWQPWAARDWAAQCGSLQIDDEPAQAFTGTHPLGEPQWLLPVWLRHLTRHGATAPAGTVVTTGTWTPPLRWRPGQRVRVAFDGIGEATLAG